MSTRQLLSIPEQLNSQPLERGSKAPMAELPSCYVWVYETGSGSDVIELSHKSNLKVPVPKCHWRNLLCYDVTSSHAKPTKYHLYLKLILSFCILWVVRSVTRNNMTKTRNNCCNVGSLLCQPCTRPRFHRMSPSFRVRRLKNDPSSTIQASTRAATKVIIVVQGGAFIPLPKIPIARKRTTWLATVIYHWGSGSAPCSSSRITSEQSGSDTWYPCPQPAVIRDTHLWMKRLSKISELIWTKYQCDGLGP